MPKNVNEANECQISRADREGFIMGLFSRRKNNDSKYCTIPERTRKYLETELRFIEISLKKGTLIVDQDTLAKARKSREPLNSGKLTRTDMENLLRVIQGMHDWRTDELEYEEDEIEIAGHNGFLKDNEEARKIIENLLR